MQHRDTMGLPACECRRYWRKGRIIDVEWWQEGRLFLETPRDAVAAVTSEYCEAHRTRIYRDLGCQYCHERPGRTRTEPTVPHRLPSSLSPHE